MRNSSFWTYKGTSQLHVASCFVHGFAPSFSLFKQICSVTKMKAWLFNLLLCKLCCIIPKRSSDASLLHSPHSKDALHSSQRSVLSIHLPHESFPRPVNRRPSLRWGRQLGPACFLVDSCDGAAHVSQEFCPRRRHLRCDDLCEGLSEDLQYDTAEDLHRTQNNTAVWKVPGQSLLRELGSAWIWTGLRFCCKHDSRWIRPQSDFQTRSQNTALLI